MARLTSKSVMAIQSACRANALTIMSTGVSTLRIRSRIHLTDAAPPKSCTADSQKWVRACFAHQHQRGQDENHYEEITSSSIVRCPPFMAEAFSPSCWIVGSTRRSIHAACAEPGERGRLLGCERGTALSYAELAERAQEGSHCGRSDLRLCVGCGF
jgi:hypothetical protein